MDDEPRRRQIPTSDNRPNSEARQKKIRAKDTQAPLVIRRKVRNPDKSTLSKIVYPAGQKPDALRLSDTKRPDRNPAFVESNVKATAQNNRFGWSIYPIHTNNHCTYKGLIYDVDSLIEKNGGMVAPKAIYDNLKPFYAQQTRRLDIAPECAL